jgi:hypothetical protein
MKKIIVLSGVSGVGKTHRRTSDPTLKQLPFIDIADIYKEHPGISKLTAFGRMMTSTEMLLRETDTVVLEAAFLPGSRQRDWLTVWADFLNAEVEYIELTAPKEILLERVECDYRTGRKLPTAHERDTARRYYEARVDFINGVHIE